jgi:hypothetical protein
LFFFAFDLFVTVLKHVRGHPSGPKISRSHPDCLLVTSSGRNIRLLTCTFILLARTGRCAAFMSTKRRRVPATPDSALQDCPRTMLQGCPLDLLLAPDPADQYKRLPVPAPAAPVCALDCLEHQLDMSNHFINCSG